MNYRKLPACLVVRRLEAWAKTIPNAESIIIFMERGTVEVFFSPIQSKTYYIDKVING